jgi:hypothetical protein
MTDHSQSNGHAEVPADPELENFGEEVKTNDIVAKAATVVVVGAGVALISAELIPGMLIGVAAAFLPGIGPKLRPLFKSTVRAGYSAVRKTREMMAEATEQMHDMVAEAKAEHETKSEPVATASAHSA